MGKVVAHLEVLDRVAVHNEEDKIKRSQRSQRVSGQATNNERPSTTGFSDETGNDPNEEHRGIKQQEKENPHHEWILVPCGRIHGNRDTNLEPARVRKPGEEQEKERSPK
jgi:hypothetical protein